MIRLQEVLWRLGPDVNVEIRVAHGGSLVYYTSFALRMNSGIGSVS